MNPVMSSNQVSSRFVDRVSTSPSGDTDVRMHVQVAAHRHRRLCKPVRILALVSHKMKGRILVVLICLPVSACGRREMIPTSELNEIRQLAFDCATKRYVLSDATIESESQAIKNKPSGPPQEEQRDTSGNLTHEYIEARFKAAARELAGLVPVVATVKGVQLTLSTPNLCLIKFDFEPSHNPHAELPENQATAERFERPDGSHYWVIVWK